MEVKDLIGIVLDLSNKGSEYNEEIQNLNLTVKTLQDAIQDMQQNEIECENYI